MAFTSKTVIFNYICLNCKVFSTSSIIFKNSLARERKFLGKMLKEKSDKKKWYNAAEKLKTPILSSAITLTKGAMEGKKSINSKRITVLNKMFMKNITDLMTTGMKSSEFIGYGIEISQVKVTPDFNGVLVYWLAKGTKNDNIIQTLLTKNAGALRHELSQLKVMGVVPKITFIKDKYYAKAVEVDLILANADFGDDYIPADTVQRLKSEFSLNTNLSSKVKEKILKIDQSLCESNDSIPSMKTNIFGLDHDYIMVKVQKSMMKSLAIHRTKNEYKSDPNIRHTNMSIAYPTVKTQKEAFEKFLHKRKLLETKLNRREKNFIPETEFIQELLESDFNTKHEENFENDDYLEDTEHEL